MSSPFVPDNSFWSEMVAVTGVGSMLIVGLAALGASLIRSPAWQRTVWRAAMAALALFILVEWIGFSTRAASLVRFSSPAENVPVETDEAFAGEQSGETQEAFWAAEDASAFGDWPFDEWEEEAESLALTLAPAHDLHAAPPGEPAAPDPAAGVWWPARVWGHGMLLCALWVVWTRWRLRRLRQRYAVGSEDLRWQSAGALADRLGLRRSVTLLEVPGLDSPVAFGVFRPAVAVPADFARDGLQRDHESVLAHEVSHLAANDPLWQLVADLVCTAWWWQPLAWWARRQLRCAGEAAADEASLLVPGGPQALAASLVALGRRLVVERSFGWLAVHGYGFRSGLGRRVQRLLDLDAADQRLPSRSYLRIANPAFCFLLMAVAVLWTVWAEPLGISLHSPALAAGLSDRWWQSSLAAMTLTSWLGAAAPEERAAPAKPPETPPAETKEPTAPAAPAPRPEPTEREQLERRLHDLEAMQYQLRAEGKFPESVPIGREMREIRQRLGLALPPAARVSLDPATREERELRARRLRSAAKLLRAAGDEWEWDAQRMLQVADRLTRDTEMASPKPTSARESTPGSRAGPGVRPKPHPRGSTPPSDSKGHAPGEASQARPAPDPQAPPELLATMRSLSEEVLKMRKELAEMREQLKQATGVKPTSPK